NNDLVMWDNATESLWQQILGEAIVGERAGSRLQVVPSSLVRWADFKQSFRDGEVLSRDTGIGIRYDAQPYVGYSSRSGPLFAQELDDRFPALERVVGVNVGEAAKAYPFSLITETGVVNDTLGGVPIVVFWGAADTADALDRRDITESQGIGTGIAYHSTVDGRALTFTKVGDETFADEQTGTRWNILGLGVEGPLKSTQLELAIHRNEFWFAWATFFPDGAVFDDQA
ncbi:MAG: DUF3179 domain-containing (seleno)protein, partial [Acidimicrobiia bacterium]